MKINLSLLKSSGVLLAAACMAVSCSKDLKPATEPDPVEKEQTTATIQADAQSEIIFDDVFNNVMGVSSTVGMGETGEFQSRKSSPNFKEEPCFTLKMEYLG